VWGSEGQDGSGFGIFGQRFSSSGVPQGGEFQVNTYTEGNQSHPSVAMDSVGNFVVVWEGAGEGDDFGMFGQRFSASGVPQGAEFRANSVTAGPQYTYSLAAVAMDAVGNFVITWNSEDGNQFGIFAQRFDAAGAPVGNEFPINVYTGVGQPFASNQTDPAVGMSSSGDFVIAWRSVNAPGDDEGVWARHFNSAGVPLGGDFHVNSFIPNTQSFPTVAMNAAGDFLIAWESSGQEDGRGIYAQRFNAAGVPQAGEFRANTYTTGDQYHARAAIAADGRFIIAWSSDGQDGSGWGNYAQAFTASGAPDGSEFRVNRHAAGNQLWPSPAYDGDGDLIMTWNSDGQDGSSWGIFAQRYIGGTKPHATLNPLNPIFAPGLTPNSLAVTYQDDVGINVATIGIDDISISAPNGPNLPITSAIVDINTNGSPRTVTYSFSPPGGAWDPVDNAVYSVRILPNQVFDIDNPTPNAIEAGLIGSFVVGIPPYIVDQATDIDDGNYSPGHLSLREAIRLANVSPGADTISFDSAVFGAHTTISVGSTLAVTGALTVSGPAAGLTLDANNLAFRIFDIDVPESSSNVVSLSNLTLKRGNAPDGSAIRNLDEDLQLHNVTIRDNQGGPAVALVSPTAILSANNSSFVFNTNLGLGGALYLNGANATITNSTFSGNTGSKGGAIAQVGDGALTINNSTIASNTATAGAGGGIYRLSSEPFTFRSSIIALNNGVNGPDIFQAQESTLNVRALIDGRDQLIIRSNTLEWHHFDFAAVGRHEGRNEPTILTTTSNGVTVMDHYNWIPDWPEPPPAEIRYEAFSSVFTNLNPPAPASAEPVTLEIIQARSSLSIVQQPSAANDFTTLLQFDDNNGGGSDWYEGRLTFSGFTSPPIAGDNNLIGVADVGNFTLAGANNLTGTANAPLNPLLGALTSNGGLTPTLALLSGSPAINSGANPLDLATDQRGIGYQREFGPAADIGAFERQTITAPLVTSVRVNDGAAQRSRITSLTITFDSIVTFESTVAEAFSLFRNGGKPVSFKASSSVVNGVTVVTLNNFTGSSTQFGSLADGRYTLTALSSHISANGLALDGDGDGQPGGNYVFGDGQGLFRMFGDINGDRQVDGADFGALSFTYGSLANQSNFLWFLDVNGDGQIDGFDFSQFSGRYNTVLP
jgi:hypothetical protein